MRCSQRWQQEEGDPRPPWYHQASKPVSLLSHAIPALPAASTPFLCQAVCNRSLLTVLRAPHAAPLPPCSPSLLAPR